MVRSLYFVSRYYHLSTFMHQNQFTNPLNLYFFYFCDLSILRHREMHWILWFLCFLIVSWWCFVNTLWTHRIDWIWYFVVVPHSEMESLLTWQSIGNLCDGHIENHSMENQEVYDITEYPTAGHRSSVLYALSVSVHIQVVWECTVLWLCFVDWS